LPAFAVCIAVSIFFLVPLLATILGGFRSNGDLQTQPFSIPRSIQWQNFGNILKSGSLFWPALENSVLILIGTVVLLLVFACPAAFVLARMSFPGRELVFNFFLFGLLFPLSVAFLPLYITIRQLGLLDSLWAVILPQVAFGFPLTILILRNAFRTIPSELEDAATMDGASPAVFFLRILLPLSRPAIAAVGVFAAVGSWNNFLLPLLVLNQQNEWTLPIGATEFQQNNYSTDFASVLAFTTLAMIPALVVYLAAERQMVAGLTAGAVRG
ncbi:MAG TPA: carbohydrate ABC transporter permease, partial [Ktedonobacterales bacterium]|nr:carbohydrate ABC transporter permease [Ktedonobacterales bacterium]